MLYNDYPRTFDLNDVIGVMNICDRHLGAIAMRVSCNLFCPLCCVRVHPDSAHSRSLPRLCVDSFDCEGPLQLYNRPFRLRPTAAASEFCRGCIYYHLICASTQQVVSKPFMQIELVERDD